MKFAVFSPLLNGRAAPWFRGICARICVTGTPPRYRPCASRSSCCWLLASGLDSKSARCSGRVRASTTCRILRRESWLTRCSRLRFSNRCGRLTCGCTSKNRGRASSPHRCGWSMSFGGSFCGPPRSPRHTRSSFAVCCCASAGQVLSHCTGHASAGDSDAVSGGACVLLCVGLLFTATLPSIDHMGSPFSLVILPLGFASSTYFPLPDVAWLRDILQFNPLHHLCEGLRWLLLRGEFTSHLGACAGLCGLLILLLVPLDVKLLRKRVFGDT